MHREKNGGGVVGRWGLWYYCRKMVIDGEEECFNDK